MKRTAEDIMKLIKEEDIKMVDFKIVDINGQFRHVTIPASQFTVDTMKDGIGFDASNYGYAVVEKKRYGLYSGPRHRCDGSLLRDFHFVDYWQCDDHRLS